MRRLFGTVELHGEGRVGTVVYCSRARGGMAMVIRWRHAASMLAAIERREHVTMYLHTSPREALVALTLGQRASTRALEVHVTCVHTCSLELELGDHLHHIIPRHHALTKHHDDMVNLANISHNHGHVYTQALPEVMPAP